MCFKNLIEIYEKELERKISKGENYYRNEVNYIKRYYYASFAENLSLTLEYSKKFSKKCFEMKAIDIYNSEMLFISLCEKYFPEIK